MNKLFFWFLIVLLLIAPREGWAERAIPSDNLAYPVLVSLDTGSKGSGFFLSTGSGVYLVTSAHVLFDESSGNLRGRKAELLCYSKNPKETGKNIVQLDLSTLSAAKRIRKHSTEDVAIVYVADAEENASTGSKRLRTVPGASLTEKTPSGILSVSLDNVKRFDKVWTANTIYMFGYPTSLSIKGDPQIDPVRPLLRFGIIAGTNPARKTIILDCPSYPGNSGGPVLEVEKIDLVNLRFHVIGVVSQFVPFAEPLVNPTRDSKSLTISNSGYTVAVSMD
ncbi:MAG: serine protease, partial [Victivallales bacterium]